MGPDRGSPRLYMTNFDIQGWPLWDRSNQFSAPTLVSILETAGYKSKQRMSVTRGRTTMGQQDLFTARGGTAFDRNGGEVGTVGDIYIDRDTNRPEWALVT